MYVIFEGDHGVWFAKYAVDNDGKIETTGAITGTGRVKKDEDDHLPAVNRAIACLEGLALIEERKNQVTSV